MYLEGLAEQFPALKNGQCKHILSKEMFYDVPRVGRPRLRRPAYTGVSTHILPLGPDNKACGMDSCKPGRACFVQI